MSRAMLVTLYGAGLLVGVAAVLVPSASLIFRSDAAHALSAHEYGLLFVPMILGAIAASTAGGPLAARIGLKRVLLVAQASLVVSIGLIAATAALVHRHALDYRVLLVANALLGAGFGGGMTALNSYAPRLAPARPQSALTAMHAIVGLGTVLPPVALPRVFALGAWWSFPVALAVALVAVAVVVTMLPLDRLAAPAPATGATARAEFSSLWLFCAVAALYGLLEALFADWGGVFLHEERMLEPAVAGLAVSFFWGTVTLGRVSVAVATRSLSPRVIHIALPLGIAAALFVARGVSGPVGGTLALALGGLGCSSFLPLTIGAAAAADPSRSETATGFTFAAYLVGNGIGGSGVGVVRDLVAVPIGVMYLVGAALAVGLTLLAAQSLSARR